MDDIKLAQLGDKEAAKRLTDAGVLVPCPKCGKYELKEEMDLKKYDVTETEMLNER